MKQTKTYHIKDVLHMQLFGMALANVIKKGDIIALEGDLGAGKTTLSQAIGKGLGVAGAMRSPTFAIASEYDIAGGKLIHADVYRLSDEDELYAIGFEDYFTSDNIVMIEWANLIADFLTDEMTPTLGINIQYDGEGRRIDLTADDSLIEQLEKNYDTSN